MVSTKRIWNFAYRGMWEGCERGVGSVVEGDVVDVKLGANVKRWGGNIHWNEDVRSGSSFAECCKNVLKISHL